MTEIRQHPIAGLVWSAKRLAVVFLLGVSSLSITGALPSVARTASSESDSALEMDLASLEAALPCSHRHEAPRHVRDVDHPAERRDGGTHFCGLLGPPAAIVGHRLANGLTAPLVC